jgi:hypothetical protein
MSRAKKSRSSIKVVLVNTLCLSTPFCGVYWRHEASRKGIVGVLMIRLVYHVLDIRSSSLILFVDPDPGQSVHPEV